MSDRLPTRTAGIYKRPRQRGAVFEARYRTKTGEQVGRTFPTLEEAEGFLIEQKHRVRAGEYIDKSQANTPWSVVAEQWMNSKRRKGRKVRTLKGYQHTLDSWCSDWNDWPVGSIGFGDVETLIARMVDEGKAPQTVRNVFNVVRGVLSHAVKAGYTRANPALLLSDDLPPQATTHEPRFLTADEVARLAATLDDKSALIVRLAAWSGLRAGEIAGLRFSRVDVLRARVTVAETVVALKGELRADTPKSKKSNRVVPIPPALAHLLDEHVRAQGIGPDDYLFGCEGRPHNHAKWYLGAFVPATVAADLAPLRFHDLRHTYASLMHAQGRSMLEVSRWMGHSTYRITADIYSHVWDDEDGTLGDALDAAFLGAAASPPLPTVRRIG